MPLGGPACLPWTELAQPLLAWRGDGGAAGLRVQSWDPW